MSDGVSLIVVIICSVLFFPVLFAAYVFVKAITYAFYRAKHKEEKDWEEELKDIMKGAGKDVK